MDKAKTTNGAATKKVAGVNGKKTGKKNNGKAPKSDEKKAPAQKTITQTVPKEMVATLQAEKAAKIKADKKKAPVKTSQARDKLAELYKSTSARQAKDKAQGKTKPAAKADKKKAPAKAPVKKAPVQPPRPSYDKSHKQVAHDILSKAAAPMNARQISDIMVSDGQISGKTPQATVGRDLCMNEELFAKVARGRYVAIKYIDDPKIAQVILGHKPVGTVKAFKKAWEANGGKVPAALTPQQRQDVKATKAKVNAEKAAKAGKKKAPVKKAGNGKADKKPAGGN